MAKITTRNILMSDPLRRDGSSGNTAIVRTALSPSSSPSSSSSSSSSSIWYTFGEKQTLDHNLAEGKESLQADDLRILRPRARLEIQIRGEVKKGTNDSRSNEIAVNR